MDTINWLDTHSGSATVILTFMLTIITAVYVWLTKRSVAVLETQKMDSALPIVVAKWMNSRNDEYIDRNSHLVIQNCGQGTALLIKAKIMLVWKVGECYPDRVQAINALMPSDTFHTDILMHKIEEDGVICDLLAVNVHIEYHDIYKRNISTAQGISNSDDEGGMYISIDLKPLLDSPRRRKRQ